MKHVMDGGLWKAATKVFVKDAGLWKEAQAVHVKDNGAWRLAHSGYRGDILLPFDSHFSDVIYNVGGTPINGASIDASAKWGGGSLRLQKAAQQSVNYGASPAAEIFMGDYGTIQCWIYLESEPNTGNGYCILSRNSVMFYVRTGMGLTCDVGNGAVQVQAVAGPWSPALGQWHHVAITKALNVYRAYANGVLLAQATQSATVGAADSLVVGRFKIFSDRYFDGRIDDLQVCVDRALYTGATYSVPSGPL